MPSGLRATTIWWWEWQSVKQMGNMVNFAIRTPFMARLLTEAKLGWCRSRILVNGASLGSWTPISCKFRDEGSSGQWILSPAAAT